MNKFINFTIFTFLFLFAFYANSESNPEYQELLLEKYYSSIDGYQKQEKNCKDISKVLPREIFSKIKINSSDLSVVLGFHFYKSFFECTATSRSEYFLAAPLLALESKKAREMVATSTELLMFDHKALIQVEMDYSMLDARLRNKLSTIQKLKSPFLLLESFELLEAENKSNDK